MPQCGATPDLAWLEDAGHAVVGVELSDLAIRQFFDGRGDIAAREVGRLVAHSNGNVTILCGDFFNVGPEHVSGCKAVYDRACMVALPEELRAKYVSHLRRLLPKGSTVFLVCLQYDQSRAAGPPFSVPLQEIESLYKGCEITVLSKCPANVKSLPPPLKALGVVEMAVTIRMK